MLQAILQRLILQYVEDKSLPLSWGLTLIGMLFAVQLLRNYCFGAAYVMGLHTGEHTFDFPKQQ